MASRKQRALVPQAVRQVPGLPSGYHDFLEDLKNRIRAAQVKAALSVNRELIRLYWDIGRSIIERQRTEGWGKAVVERLASDLQKAFPGIGGFSPQNVWYMRAFYMAWTEEVRKLQQPVGELDAQNLPRAVAEIPWGHNLQLLSKLKTPDLRLWYAKMAVEHGWSRAVLVHQIESGLYERQGKALTNFKRTLPPPQSDLAQETIKDPYTFDFLTLGPKARERDLEQGLLDHLQRFLIELGVGFAFVGRQVHMEVGNEDFYIDLLFYHLRLRCYVVIELKTGAFKPEYAGKMNFYLSAVDDRLRHKDDQPSVGIILCKSKNHLIAEYALRDANKPIGVAAYKLTKALPEKLKGTLPSPEELEEELEGNYSEVMAEAMGYDQRDIEEYGAENLIASHSGTKYVKCSCGKFYELRWTEWPGFRDMRPVLCPNCKKQLGTHDLDHMSEISERDYLLKGEGLCPKDRTRLKLVEHRVYKPGAEEWDVLRCPKCRAKYQVDTV